MSILSYFQKKLRGDTSPQNNYAATTAPAATDDATQGYTVGSKWYDTVAKEAYVCVDSTATAAVWSESTLTADELGSAAFAATGDFDAAGAAAAAQAAAIQRANHTGTQAISTVAGLLEELAAKSEDAFPARNNTGAHLPHGASVRVIDSQGQTPVIALADNTTLAGIVGYAGIIVEPGGIADNATGQVQALSVAENLDTTGSTEGHLAFVGEAGGRVYGPDPSPTGIPFIQKIGVVLNVHATQGKIKLLPDFLGTAIGNAVKTAGTKAAAIAAIGADTIRHIVVAGTSYELNAANSGSNVQISFTAATPVTLTIDDSLAYDGDAALVWFLRQRGAGAVTVNPTGVTVSGNLTTAGQHTSMCVVQAAADQFETEGGV